MYKHIVVHRASSVNHRLDFGWNSRRSMEVLSLGRPSEPLPCKPRISSVLYFNLATQRKIHGEYGVDTGICSDSLLWNGFVPISKRQNVTTTP